MSLVHAIIADLRERRLWPIALALAVAIVAVPVALAKHAPAPAARAAAAPAAGRSFAQLAAAAPAVTVDAALQHSRLAGPARDPFKQGRTVKLSLTGTSLATAPGSSGGSSSTSAHVATATPGGGPASGGMSTASAGGSSPASGPAPAPPSNFPVGRPTRPVTGLRPDQSYEVTVALTRSDGGIDTINSLERLGILPNPQNRLLVELGVLQGGRRVLFAVMPGTVVGGPGQCIPGPLDCELIALAQNQVETVSGAAASAPVTQFAVTAITATNDGSFAAADAARRRSYAGGARLLAASQLDALSLFQYEPSVGAVVDLRNLNGGGS